MAWKFTPDSASGKRLMARCRQLHQENEDLGRMIASGKLSKLESELALQKNLTETFKQNEVEVGFLYIFWHKNKKMGFNLEENVFLAC